MTGREADEEDDGRLRTDDGDGKENGRGGVDDDGEESGEGENGAEICGEDRGERNRKRNEIGVVATIEKDCVPSPKCGDSGDDDG